jgi:hypothetical protein
LSQPSKAVLKLHRDTGKLLGSLNLVDRYGADIIHPVVQATDDMLVVTAVRAGRQTDSNADDPVVITGLVDVYVVTDDPPSP